MKTLLGLFGVLLALMRGVCAVTLSAANSTDAFSKRAGLSRLETASAVMLLAILGLAAPVSAQSTATELADSGTPYVVTSLVNMNTYSVRITSTGGGNISVEATNVSVFPNVSLGTQTADDNSGYFPGSANAELVFTDGSGDTIGVYFGTASGDNIVGTGYDCEIFFGMDGDDTITAGSGSVMLAFGGIGLDSIYGDSAPDEIWLGFRSIRDSRTGTEYAEGGAGMDSIFSDNVDSDVHGDAGVDSLFGGTRSDYLFGMGANDLIWGGPGDDYIEGNDGCDDLFGDSGFGYTNNATGSDGDDVIYGGDDDDLIRGEDGDDTLYGEADEDAIDGGAGVDTIYGGTENDWLHDVDGVGGNYVDGGSEDDEIYVLDGNTDDAVQTGSGADEVWRDVLMFTQDTVSNSSGTDTLNSAGTPTGYGAGNGFDAFENKARDSWWGTWTPGVGSSSRTC